MEELKLIRTSVIINMLISILSMVLIITLSGKACYLFGINASGISNGCLYNYSQEEYVEDQLALTPISMICIAGIVLGAMAYKKVKYMMEHPEYTEMRRTSKLCVFFSMPIVLIGPFLAFLSMTLFADTTIPSIDLLIGAVIITTGMLIWAATLVLWIIALAASNRIRKYRI